MTVGKSFEYCAWPGLLLDVGDLISTPHVGAVVGVVFELRESRDVSEPSS